ncbi:MAG: hypothetical protein IKO00_03475 [Oscillospiraceae bacterium]|nr:hypothetical protein [Oscillospiraceae bacterium]
MAGSWRDGKILCPFFRGEDRQRHKIICEGPGDARSISWNFANEDERQRIRQLEVFCQDRYACCEIYRMLQESKYGDQTGG